MAEKNFNVRQTQKTDTAENWSKATGFIPKKGELIIYQEGDETTSKIKIGDGKNYVKDLGFSGGAESSGGFQPGSDNLDMGGKEIHNVSKLDLTYIVNDKEYGVGLLIEQENEELEENEAEVAVLHFYGLVGDERTRLRHLAPGKNEDDAVTYGQLLEGLSLLNDFNDDIAQLYRQVGDIETALDSIIEIQNSLIGGE